MPDLPTGTVTLLFTDMEGSTHLLQQLGERYTTVLADCRHLLRRAFAQYHGHEVDTQGVPSSSFLRVPLMRSQLLWLYNTLSPVIRGLKAYPCRCVLGCIPANRY